MSELILYDFPESANSYKIRLLLNLLDKPYKLVKVDGLRGGSRTPEFYKKNVDRRLPVLELEDGTALAESNAILYYLSQGTPYFSENHLEQTQILRWMFFEQDRIECHIGTLRFRLQHIDERLLEFEDNLKKRGIDALGVMDDHLKNHDFFELDRFTIADIALYGYTHVAGEAGIELSNFPNIQKWIKRVEERERFIPFTER